MERTPAQTRQLDVALHFLSMIVLADVAGFSVATFARTKCDGSIVLAVYTHLKLKVLFRKPVQYISWTNVFVDLGQRLTVANLNPVAPFRLLMVGTIRRRAVGPTRQPTVVSVNRPRVEPCPSATFCWMDNIWGVQNTCPPIFGRRNLPINFVQSTTTVSCRRSLHTLRLLLPPCRH